jgi:cyclopropane-fatty-acyl-phospholipid synthase
MPNYQTIVCRYLEEAGVQVNGNNSWDIQVHHPDFYKRAILQGTLGIGESYMDGCWSCEAIDALFHRMLTAGLHKKIDVPVLRKIANLKSRLINLQNKIRSKAVADKHYNPDTDIILAFLDPYNQYTCAYFKETDDLNTAQRQKLALICQKLGLSAGDRVLDIGCGWGGFARFAAETIGCHVTGISIAQEQISFARDFCKGLPVEFHLADYRDIEGSFSKILVCGMIEHVGHQNYRRLMKIVCNHLDDNGLFLVQTIGGTTSLVTGDPWLLKYFFPNAMLPSIKQISESAEGLFTIEDIHNFGQYYDNTFMAWYANFIEHWPRIKDHYDDRLYRMWTYYFQHMAGTFRARLNQLWQIVFSKNGIPGGYLSVR